MKTAGLLISLFLTFVLAVNGQQLLALVVLLASAPAWVFREKLGIETQGPLCLWRTKRGLAFLDKLASARKAWLVFTDIGLIFAFGVFGAIYLYTHSHRTLKDKALIIAAYGLFAAASLAITMPYAFVKGLAGVYDLAAVLLIGGIGSFVFYALALNTWSIFQNYLIGVQPAPGIAPIIPGVQVEGSPLFFPVHALFGLVVLLIVHELAHGVVSRAQNIRVKSMGLLTSGVVPIGAFAEPDEKMLKRVSPLKRMRVFNAGSMANFAAGLLFAVLFLTAQAVITPKFVQDPHVSSPGVFIPFEKPYVNHLQVIGVENNTPAAEANITNETKIFNIQIMLAEKTPFKNETLETQEGNITLQRNASGMLGLFYRVVKNESAYTPAVWAGKYFFETIFWIFALNFIVGIINLLPFAAFDGAHVLTELYAYYFKKTAKQAKKVMLVIYVIIAALLTLNAVPYFLKI